MTITQPSPEGQLLSETFNGERLLRGGVNFTNRAELRYAHAVRLINDLNGRIYEWEAAETLFAGVHSVDDHTVEFRLVVKRPPPIEEWSLILGDALHNFRSLYDIIAWEFAHLDGAVPKKPGQVTFPITLDEKDWDRASLNLESVPSDLLARIRLLQAWDSGVPREDTVLWLLHRLNILDKHRGVISADLRVTTVSTAGIDLRMEPAATSFEAQLEYQVQSAPVQAKPGVVVLTLRCPTHNMNPDPDFLAKVWVAFAVSTEDGRQTTLSSFTSALVTSTRENLDLLYGGRLFAEHLAQSRSATNPSVASAYVDEQGVKHLSLLRMLPPRTPPQPML